jgi:mitogen-activated protein kinase kinase 7
MHFNSQFKFNYFYTIIYNNREAANSDKFRDIVTNAGYLLIGNKRIKTTMDDLTPICELGSGTCGHVIKMKHNSTGYIMAVKVK